MYFYSLVLTLCWVLSLAHDDPEFELIKKTTDTVRNNIHNYELEKKKLEMDKDFEMKKFKRFLRGFNINDKIKDSEVKQEFHKLKQLTNNFTMANDLEAKFHKDIDLHKFHLHSLELRTKSVEVEIDEMEGMRKRGDLEKCKRVVENYPKPRSMIGNKKNKTSLQYLRTTLKENITKLELSEKQNQLLKKEIQEVKDAHKSAIKELTDLTHQRNLTLSAIKKKVTEKATMLASKVKQVEQLEKEAKGWKQQITNKEKLLGQIENNIKNYIEDYECYKTLMEM